MTDCVVIMMVDEKKEICIHCKKEMTPIEIGDKGTADYRKVWACWDCHEIFYNTRKTLKTIVIGGLSEINTERGTFEITLTQIATINHLPQWDKKMLKVTIEEYD